jgi:isocitrate dehydrogenase kinase/phosphatase|eukprot:CAMPEP_0202497684 /NCGR_PEP_ID=MMETSP1361-20130828/23540_1 /ASSEMBLY_ACC=CAM_ASM_000849 /TAXON_ID=210615 /ORGANISM="Staurosira complex sp., Strain CCMP2646" /LENGTH=143 /DNA_ID=CAMNT_0049129357 /DNA_START=140 /DNA_END=571 /DNA_ORIENTATION=-
MSPTKKHSLRRPAKVSPSKRSRSKVYKRTPAPRKKSTHKKIPFEPKESRLILLGVNTIGPSWKRIFKAHRDEFENNKRTDIKLKDRYRQMVKDGEAVDLGDLEDDEDCFTKKGRKTYGIKRNQVDPVLMDEYSDDDDDMDEDS